MIGKLCGVTVKFTFIPSHPKLLAENKYLSFFSILLSLQINKPLEKEQHVKLPALPCQGYKKYQALSTEWGSVHTVQSLLCSPKFYFLDLNQWPRGQKMDAALPWFWSILYYFSEDCGEIICTPAMFLHSKANELQWFSSLLPFFGSTILLPLICCRGRPVINRQIGSGWLKPFSLGRLGGLASQPLEAHYYSNKRIDPFIKLPWNFNN